MALPRKPYFRGQSIHRLDGKGRLRVPTKFREVLQNHYTDALVVTMTKGCLVAYPPEVWDKIESKAKDLSLVQPEHRDFMRYYISCAEECEFDNQGRVLIPPLLRDRAKLDQEVLLAGMLTCFEIWNKTAWEEQISWDDEQYHQVMEKIAGAGL